MSTLTCWSLSFRCGARSPTRTPHPAHHRLLLCVDAYLVSLCNAIRHRSVPIKTGLCPVFGGVFFSVIWMTKLCPIFRGVLSGIPRFRTHFLPRFLANEFFPSGAKRLYVASLLHRSVIFHMRVWHFTCDSIFVFSFAYYVYVCILCACARVLNL